MNNEIQFTCLRQEFDAFKSLVTSELQHIKHQNKLILKRVETLRDKFKTWSDLKKEITAFFSTNGHSNILNTSSLFKKVFSLLFLIALLYGCIFYVDLNIKSFQANEVITQIKVSEDETLIFPAITLCLLNNSAGLISTPNLSDIFLGSYFDSRDNTFSVADFEYFPMYDPKWDSNLNCYKFNAGRNSTRHETEIISGVFIGYDSGFFINLNRSEGIRLYYFVGDNQVKPMRTELELAVELNTKSDQNFFNIGIKKTVDMKLPKPFSNCIRSIRSEMSHLVKKIMEQNMTYRQEYCYELCYYDYLKEYAVASNMSITLAYDLLVFDVKGNCSRICPLECVSTSFSVLQSEISNFESDQLWLNFHYSDRKYTEISQLVKTTEADLVSNTGGVVGLFLDLSFFHAYKFISYITGIFFVWFDCTMDDPAIDLVARHVNS